MREQITPSPLNAMQSRTLAATVHSLTSYMYDAYAKSPENGVAIYEGNPATFCNNLYDLFVTRLNTETMTAEERQAFEAMYNPDHLHAVTLYDYCHIACAGNESKTVDGLEAIKKLGSSTVSEPEFRQAIQTESRALLEPLQTLLTSIHKEITTSSPPAETLKKNYYWGLHNALEALFDKSQEKQEEASQTAQNRRLPPPSAHVQKIAKTTGSKRCAIS